MIAYRVSYGLFLVEAGFMCLSIVAYWRTKLKGWLLSALGFFFLSSGFMGTLIIEILKAMFPPPTIFRFVDYAFYLELYTSVVLIAIGWGLALKQSWNKHRTKLNFKALHGR